MTENKNDSINSILQHSWKAATTYSAIIKIFEYENLLLLKLPQITRNNIKHCNQCEKKRTIILSYLSGAFQTR